MACDTYAPVRNIGYRVIVELTNEQDKIGQKLDRKTWLNLLNLSDSDFATNMILYGIYDRDAKMLSMKENIYGSENLYESWKRLMKTEDLEYWELYLK